MFSDGCSTKAAMSQPKSQIIERSSKIKDDFEKTNVESETFTHQ